MIALFYLCRKGRRNAGVALSTPPTAAIDAAAAGKESAIGERERGRSAKNHSKKVPEQTTFRVKAQLFSLRGAPQRQGERVEREPVAVETRPLPGP